MISAWIDRVPLAAVALYFLLSGVYGALTRKARVVSSYRFLVIFVAFLLFQIGWLISIGGARTFGFQDASLLVMFGLFFLMMWKVMRGYTILGATDDYPQAALHSALHKLNLPFEESVARLRLTSLNAELKVSPSRLGSALLTLRSSHPDGTLRLIAASMNEYFSTTPGKLDMSGFYLYSALGFLMLVQEFGIFRSR